jgi:two-component system, OmpR family, sensor histidine kinase CiaH
MAIKYNLFYSARLKLMFFYLVVILVFSLSVTLGLKVIASKEYERSNRTQLNRVQDMTDRFYDRPSFGPQRPDLLFRDTQADATEAAHQRVDRGFILMNIGVLLIGAALSYWFAGRTLRPIEEAHESQKRFTADASHELRTPLASMRLENEVFLRVGKFSENEAREQIKSNLQEIKRLERLSDKLLTLAQTGARNSEIAEIDISAVISEAVENVKRKPQAKDFDISQKITPAKVLSNKEDLRQVLDIVLDNALKYGTDGKVIKVVGKIVGQEYEITVVDKGIGIADSDLPHIFERLYRGDKSRQKGGYGLGLSLAKEILEAADGRIEARNAIGGGAVFEVTLPL